MKTIKELEKLNPDNLFYEGWTKGLKDILKLISEKDEWTYEELKLRIEGNDVRR